MDEFELWLNHHDLWERGMEEKAKRRAEEDLRFTRNMDPETVPAVNHRPVIKDDSHGPATFQFPVWEVSLSNFC